MDLRGHLDLLLLATLRRTGPTHGYALIAALREQSGGAFDLPEGTVYPALHRLERAGEVASRWSTDAPRRRRVYELTPAGVAALAAKRREWQGFARGVSTVLGNLALPRRQLPRRQLPRRQLVRPQLLRSHLLEVSP